MQIDPKMAVESQIYEETARAICSQKGSESSVMKLIFQTTWTESLHLLSREEIISKIVTPLLQLVYYASQQQFPSLLTTCCHLIAVCSSFLLFFFPP